MNGRFVLFVFEDIDGWVCESLDLRGCTGVGDTWEEAVQSGVEARKLYLEDLYAEDELLKKLEPCRKCGSPHTTIERQTLLYGTVAGYRVEGPDEVEEITLIAKCDTCGRRVHSRGEEVEEVSRALAAEWNGG